MRLSKAIAAAKRIIRRQRHLLRSASSPMVEAFEKRMMMSNAYFLPATGSWNTGANWSPSGVPNSGNGAVTAIISQNQVANFTSAVFPVTNIYVGAQNQSAGSGIGPSPGSGAFNGELDLGSGQINVSGGIYLGHDSGAYGLLFQGGTSTISTGTLELGSASGTWGELDLVGGTITSTTTNVGNQGYGTLTVGGGALTTSALNINKQPAAVNSSSGSYVNVGQGSITVNGDVTLGSNQSTASVVVSGGAFSWKGGMTLGSNTFAFPNDTLDVRGPANSTISQAQVTWSNSGSGTALTVDAGGILQFDLTPLWNTSSGGLNLGTGSLAVSGGKLVIDGSQLSGADASSHTYTLAKFAGFVGGSSANFSSPSITGFVNRAVSVTEGATSITITVGPTTSPPGATIVGGGAIESPGNATYNTQDYNYAPASMYDSGDGLYKVWTTFNEYLNTTNKSSGTLIDGYVGGDTLGFPAGQSYQLPNGAVVTTGNGDHIGVREAPTLNLLQYTPIRPALTQSNDTTKFDAADVADPTVYRNGSGGVFYLAYTGNVAAGTNGTQSRIGIAQSLNGGRSFSPEYVSANSSSAAITKLTPPAMNTATGSTLVTGTVPAWTTNSSLGAILVPNTYNYPNGSIAGTYGVGQPAVAKDTTDGMWYMAFTYQPAYNNSNPSAGPSYLMVIKSSQYDFGASLNATNTNITEVTAFPITVPSGDPFHVSDGVSASVGMAYDPLTNEFILACNNTPGDAFNNVAGVSISNINLLYFDSSWNYLQTQQLPLDGSGSFGEGISITTNEAGDLTTPDSMALFASTYDSAQGSLSSNPAYGSAHSGGLSYLNVIVPSDQPVATGGSYFLFSGDTADVPNHVADVYQDSTTAGARIDDYTYGGNSNQRWTANVQQSTGFVTFQSQHNTSMYLAANTSSGSTVVEQNTLATLGASGNLADAQWQVLWADGTKYELVNIGKSNASNQSVLSLTDTGTGSYLKLYPVSIVSNNPNVPWDVPVTLSPGETQINPAQAPIANSNQVELEWSFATVSGPRLTAAATAGAATADGGTIALATSATGGTGLVYNWMLPAFLASPSGYSLTTLSGGAANISIGSANVYTESVLIFDPSTLLSIYDTVTFGFFSTDNSSYILNPSFLTPGDPEQFQNLTSSNAWTFAANADTTGASGIAWFPSNYTSSSGPPNNYSNVSLYAYNLSSGAGIQSQFLGQQAAFLLGKGVITQNFVIQAAGTYHISFYATPRVQDAARESFNVSAGSMTLSNCSPALGSPNAPTPWVKYNTSSSAVAANTHISLIFSGLTLADTDLISDVQLVSG